MSTRHRRVIRTLRTVLPRSVWRGLAEWLPNELDRWLRIGGKVLLAVLLVGCAAPDEAQIAPRSTLFVGVDVSGSFEDDGRWDDAMEFASYYIYGHLNGLGELEQPRALFVGSIGGETPGQPQAFHPIHDFEDKTPAEIEADLREWFAPDDAYTDFNAFFQRAATLVKRQNLALAPITLVLLTDGVPDVGRERQDTAAADRYARIDLDPLEYLARNVTVRVLYPDPAVAVHWERDVPRDRVRMWTVDAVVMEGWREQLRKSQQLAMTTERERFRDPRISGPAGPEAARQETAEPEAADPLPEPEPRHTEPVASESVADISTAVDSMPGAELTDEAADSEPTQESPTTDRTTAEPGARGETAVRQTDRVLDQPDLWRWIRDNVDFRVRRTIL